MLAERSQRIEQLYHEARERDPRERTAFLEHTPLALAKLWLRREMARGGRYEA